MFYDIYVCVHFQLLGLIIIIIYPQKNTPFPIVLTKSNQYFFPPIRPCTGTKLKIDPILEPETLRNIGTETNNYSVAEMTAVIISIYLLFSSSLFPMTKSVIYCFFRTLHRKHFITRF